jgi:hypothetical protein
VIVTATHGVLSGPAVDLPRAVATHRRGLLVDAHDGGPVGRAGEEAACLYAIASA